MSGCDRFIQGSVDRTVKCLVVTGLLRVQFGQVSLYIS